MNLSLLDMPIFRISRAVVESFKGDKVVEFRNRNATRLKTLEDILEVLRDADISRLHEIAVRENSRTNSDKSLAEHIDCSIRDMAKIASRRDEPLNVRLTALRVLHEIGRIVPSCKNTARDKINSVFAAENLEGPLWDYAIHFISDAPRPARPVAGALEKHAINNLPVV